MFRDIIFVLLMIWVIYQDFKDMIIPDTVHVGLLTNAFLFNILSGQMSIKTACIGFIMGGILLFILSCTGKMGFGDVKLMASLGAIMGYAIIDVFFLSFIIGLVFAIAYYVKLKNWEAQIPFGPSIAIAAMIVWFTGISITGIPNLI